MQKINSHLVHTEDVDVVGESIAQTQWSDADWRSLVRRSIELFDPDLLVVAPAFENKHEAYSTDTNELICNLCTS